LLFLNSMKRWTFIEVYKTTKYFVKCKHVNIIYIMFWIIKLKYITRIAHPRQIKPVLNLYYMKT